MDPYKEIAHLYDLEHGAYRDDIDFYLNVIQSGPILEVGVGTGRVTLPLVKAGFEVWGVDPSSAMLDLARARLKGTVGANLVQGDICDLHLDVRFATALMPLNVLWHMVELEERLAALRTVRGHMQSGGLLVVDLSNPHAMADRGANGEVRLRQSCLQSEDEITISSAAWDDEAAQLLRLRFMYEQIGRDKAFRRTSTEMRLHYIYAPELDLLLRHTGFRIQHIYGSHDLEPYSSSSRGIIALATKA